jgi:hypothetical protein
MVQQILAALDGELSLLEVKTAQLAELYRAIVERDDSAMERLLGVMEETQDRQGPADAALAACRANLARALNIPARELKLSVLIQHLPSSLAAPLAQRRERLIEAAASMRLQHMQTSTLLYESARLNSMMLECLGGGGEVTTYDRGGTNVWRSTSMINSRL